MAGTVKLSPPELAFVGEVVACGELFGCAETVTETLGSAAALWVCVGEAAGAEADPGVPVSADVGDAPVGAANAADDPVGAAAGELVGGFDPAAPHAVRQAPPMTAAMIAAGTRDILMPYSSDLSFK
jgi:hypothetical protein